MKGRVSTDNREFWEIGFIGTYIQDHPFNYFTRIPVGAAVEWVKKECPDVNMGNGTLAKELTIENIGNGWLNKLFILVDETYGKWIAIVKWDDNFSIYVERK